MTDYLTMYLGRSHVVRASSKDEARRYALQHFKTAGATSVSQIYALTLSEPALA